MKKGKEIDWTARLHAGSGPGPRRPSGAPPHDDFEGRDGAGDIGPGASGETGTENRGWVQLTDSGRGPKGPSGGPPGRK